MVRALYRRRHSNEDLALQIPGSSLDFAALDREAERRWGRGLIRIASWISAAPAAP